MKYIMRDSLNYHENFVELALISSGSFGQVYKAMHKVNKKLFAVKKTPIDEKSTERALKEAEFLSKLTSQFIVKLKHFWIEEDIKTHSNRKGSFLNILMELCPMTMKEAIEKLNQELHRKEDEIMTPLGYYISSELFFEILECVDFLHKLNPPVIHRDLKPTNILITQGLNGRFVKLGDFGLATTHFNEQKHTEGSGTPKYMAPEVSNGTNYDMKADIYSLSLIGQELFNIDINRLEKFLKII
jgi:serine/threonine protein kinase